MRKIFLIATIAMFSLTANAQIFSSLTGNGDTVTNTGTKTNYLKLSESFGRVTIQTTITKISGTVAGTVTLQGSLDGTNYSTVDTGAVVSKKVTFASTNVAAQNTVFIINDSPYLYYRVSYTGSGTMSASISSVVLGRRKQ